MARFQKPTDPRKRLTEQRERRHRGDSREPIPWLWLGLGLVVTLAGLGIAYFLVTSFLTREPIAAVQPTPTVIRLTAPATSEPTVTSVRPTPTPIPTFTPVPTPDNTFAPAVITVGYYAVVANTAGIGVSVRGGPSTDNIRLLTADEGTVVLVLEGPVENGDFLWWQVELPDGTAGWVAGQFIEPADAP